MKKYIILTVSLIWFFGLPATAKIWRVSNRSLNTDPDYTSLATAISSASAGDTLYVVGSSTSYGYIKLDKKLTIIGPGYWLDVSDTTQASKLSATIRKCDFESGSRGSTLMGMRITDSWYDALVLIEDDSITLKNNYIYNARNISTYSAIKVADSYEYIMIRQNWIDKYGDGYAIYLEKRLDSSFISNNRILARGSAGYAIYNADDAPDNELVINNNVFTGILHTRNTIQFNNILISGSYEGSGDNISYSLCSGTQFENDNNNQQNVTMSLVFEDETSEVDTGYVLKINSPAIGNGADGVDCGMFGYAEDNPAYILSGLPPIPAIFEENNQYVIFGIKPVEVKAITHNARK